MRLRSKAASAVRSRDRTIIVGALSASVMTSSEGSKVGTRSGFVVGSDPLATWLPVPVTPPGFSGSLGAGVGEGVGPGPDPVGAAGSPWLVPVGAGVCAGV
ncbi:hypothetical protein [Arsenicicoccus piscis]|uniref:Uncharacterized protein n=1 Tax=Arsenicicoccus piscis TaxID=673954 RepID=A0ABQ6HSF2_9MICO|nr:hypothetical protein [Arsenicicoccus piscis]GMA21400.1 hypothetical protein GCM10025862_34210 [Arsenicicoccus piscis]